jgi:hypothetical protein
MSDIIHINVPMPAVEHQQLKAAAALQGLTLREAVRASIHEWVQSHLVVVRASPLVQVTNDE